MRRPLTTAVLAAVLAVVLTAPPASAQAAAGGGVGAGQISMAEWHVTIKGVRWWYLAEGGFVPDVTTGLPTEAYLLVARGKCTVGKGKGFGFMFCWASGQGGPIPIEQFEMAPGMESSHVEGQIGRYRHSVDWVASGPMDGGPSEGAEASPSGAGGGVDLTLYRPATASATLYGVKLKPARPTGFFFELSRNLLIQGGGAGGEVYVGEGLAAAGATMHPDGTFTIRRVYPLRGSG
jgi:hypothetical protein